MGVEMSTIAETTSRPRSSGLPADSPGSQYDQPHSGIRRSTTYETRTTKQFRGVAQLGLARLLGVQEVAGSNPVAPTI